MRVLVDFDSIFEYLHLIAAFARMHGTTLITDFESIKGRSVNDALKILGLTDQITDNVDEIKRMFATVKFKIEGFYLFCMFNQQELAFVGNIELEYAEEILKGNSIQNIQVIQWSEVNGNVKVVTCCEQRLEMMNRLGILTEYYNQQDLSSLSVDFEKIPWQGHMKLLPSLNISGPIVKGFGRGSKDLGFPTANIEVHENLPVLLGIYAGIAKLDGEFYKAAISVGVCPFYSNQQISYEVYIMNTFNDSLVGKRIECELLYYLRCESKFRNVNDLIRVIELDVKLCLELLA